MSEYNYRIKKWSQDAAKKFAKKMEKLKPGKDDNFISKEVICPIHKNEDEAYSGHIMAWQNEDKSYTLGFFFGYYCGDTFFERTTDIKKRNVEKMPLLLEQMVEKMHEIYCVEKMVDEIIVCEKSSENNNEESEN